MLRTRASLILEGGLAPVELGMRVTRGNDGSVRGAMLIVSVGDEEYAHYANHPASGLEQDLELDRMLTLLLGGSAMEGTGRTRIQEQTSGIALDDIPAAILASASGELCCLPILVKDFNKNSSNNATLSDLASNAGGRYIGVVINWIIHL